MSKKKNNKVKAKARKKKINKSKIIITSLVCVAFAILIAFAAVRTIGDAQKKSELCDYNWVSTSAKNASADEVELTEIYNNRYTNYQGTLYFEEDLRFSLWLTAGDPSDGTHSGKYVIKDENTLQVTFDDLTENEFEIIRDNDGEILSIVVPYGGYSVYFTKQ